jgi:hypothetical protein
VAAEPQSLTRLGEIKELSEMSPTTSRAWVKGIIESLDRAGLDARLLLMEAGLDPTAVEDPLARFPSERISVLWEKAAARSGNPAIGLAMQALPTPSLFDAVGYAMMSSPNLLASTERLVRYLRIVSDASTVSLSTREARVTELLSNSLAAAGPCRDSESSSTFLRCSNSFVGSAGDSCVLGRSNWLIRAQLICASMKKHSGANCALMRASIALRSSGPISSTLADLDARDV